MAAKGSLHCHQLLADCDPASQHGWRPGTRSGSPSTRGLRSHWQAVERLAGRRRSAPIQPGGFDNLIAPPRAETNAAIEQRFDKMINAGALEEVRTIADLDVELPALKALGVPHLRRHLAGDISLERPPRVARQRPDNSQNGR